jgi:hypothetical protein
VLLGGVAITRAATLHTWMSQDVLQAADLNANFAALQSQISALQNQNATGQSLGLVVLQSTVTGGVVPAPCAISLGAAVVDCTCPAGTFVVSGGAVGLGGQFLRESWAPSNTQWRATCATVGGGDALCFQYTLVCSRVAP